VFNKAIQVLKNEDPSVKKPLVVELPEEENDNLKSERGDELITKLVSMTDGSDSPKECKN